MTGLSQKWQRAIVILLEDLSLLGSLYLAQFIVWRILRRRRKERAARLKRIKLVQGASHKTLSELPVEALGDTQCKT
jgi:hypothetical protein